MADVQSCEEDAITASLSLALKCVGIVGFPWLHHKNVQLM
jgi:hypothetical protein